MSVTIRKGGPPFCMESMEERGKELGLGSLEIQLRG